MRSGFRYLVLSISDFLFLILLLFISFQDNAKMLGDGDTGYHIRAGEIILNTMSIPRSDPFSFHSPSLPWTAHEWLSEIIMAIVHKMAGLPGVVIMFSLVISLTYYIYFRILRKYTNNILLIVLFALLVISSSHIHWLARPHIFSLLIMVGWYYLIDLYQYRDRNLLYLFPLIMLLWVNLHGGFIAGFMMLALYSAGNLYSMMTAANEEQKEAFSKKFKNFTVISGICLLVSLINPYGYHILLFPFNLVFRKEIMDSVSEFMSPNFHEPLIFKYMLLLMIAVFAWSKQRLNVFETMLVLLFTNMALYSVRYIPLFAVITTPIVIGRAESLLEEYDNRFIRFMKKRAERFAAIDGFAKGFFWPVLGMLFLLVLLAQGKLNYGFDPKNKPVAAVEFLKKEHITGNMFNNDEFGDYIIYSAWPRYKVFFDGRSDMYGVDMLKEYGKITGLKPGWDKVLEKYGITWIIYNANSPLSLFLMERKDWKLIYADKVANIFVKDTKENKALIEKYPNVQLIQDDPANKQL